MPSLQRRRQSPVAQTTVEDVLIKGRNLIRDYDHWGIGYYARTADGIKCHWADPKAACFCSAGAYRKALGELLYPGLGPPALESAIFRHPLNGRACGVLMRASRALGPFDFVGLNDSLGRSPAGHKRVLKMWDEAVRIAQSERNRP